MIEYIGRRRSTTNRQQQILAICIPIVAGIFGFVLGVLAEANATASLKASETINLSTK